MDAAVDPRNMPRETRKALNGFHFELIENFSARPPAKPWLIKNIIAKGETSAWIAPPGGMKSALMAELSISVARGTDWHGHKAKRSGGVYLFFKANQGFCFAFSPSSTSRRMASGRPGRSSCCRRRQSSSCWG